MNASVVIAGAGPAGLALAGELRLGGVRVTVLERLAERSGESRGIGLAIRTAEVLAQRGLLARFGGLATAEQGHFGGVPLDFSVLDGPYRYANAVPQSVTETVLEGWARELGADLRRGHEVRSFRETPDGVAVRVSTPEGERTLHADYLVGADGGRSTVRRAGGFDFPGTPATTELLLADLRGVTVRPRGTGELLAAGMVMSAPLPDGSHRVIVGERGAAPRRRSGPPAFQEVADAWKRLTGDDISAAEPVWVSAFTDAARLVTEYRRGRVLLVGDAAHIHLPAGGQGMNTGIQDAVNLGWKLAAVLRGTAPATLLDTYHEERHPVGEALLANTAAQAQLILGGAEAAPLRAVLAELVRYPDAQRHLAAKVSGLAIRYDVGPGPNPLLGARLPHLELTGVRGPFGSGLFGSRPGGGGPGGGGSGGTTGSTGLLRTGRGVLLDLADNPHLRRRALRWRDRIDVVTARPADPGAAAALIGGTAAVLVRPDGHVAWAAPGAHHGLTAALERWFGPGRRSVPSGRRAVPRH